MIAHSVQLDFADEEPVSNPWRSHSNDQDPPNTSRRGRHSVSRDDAITWKEGDMIISPSPSPQSGQPIHPVQPSMQETNALPDDPHIASLKAIFPDFDDAVILSVLESTNNDHDRALDVLLGMNDPSFVPPDPPPSQSPGQFQSAPSSDAQRLSQEALDEQLARRLALEEQNAAAQAWQPQGVQGQTTYQPYQPRRGGRDGWGVHPQTQTQTQGGKDTMAELQDGFNRIAESGKKTFSSIVSKVKAKMQEFDQGQGRPWSQNPSSSQPPQVAAAPSSIPHTPGQQQGSEHGTYAQPYQYAQPANPQSQTGVPQPVRASADMPRSGVMSPTAAEPTMSAGAQHPSYYDPNTRGYDLYDDDDDHEIQLYDRSAPSNAAAAAATTQSPATPLAPRAPDGPVSPPPSSEASSPPSYTPRVTPPPGSAPSSVSPAARPLSSTTASARGTAPGTPGGVDFSKLGLLPKRPISLVRPQSPPAPGAGGTSTGGPPRVAATHSKSTADSSTPREEPEFVENPFEDPR